MPAQIGQIFANNWMFIAMLAFILFLAIVPQRKRNKEVKQMLDEMKRGDWVRTIGGISGRVVSVKDDLVVIETGPQHVQITVTYGAIASVGDSKVEADGLTPDQVEVASNPKPSKKK